jgi:hypothetical protein
VTTGARDQAMRPAEALTVVIACEDQCARKARYVFDTLLMAAGIPVVHSDCAPVHGPWVLYATSPEGWPRSDACLAVAHCPSAWSVLQRDGTVTIAERVDGLAVVLPHRGAGFDGGLDIDFDLVANAFYLLASYPERMHRGATSRQLYADSVYARLDIPQDIVDQYLARLVERLGALCDRLGIGRWPAPRWEGDREFAVVLSHDVDFLPRGKLDIAVQGAKTLARHLLRQRDPGDAGRALAGWLRAWFGGRDPYGCVPDIIAREQALGVRSSFQVAVAHRHPNDVNYRIEDDAVRDYLRVIDASGFDLCLHGSYRSTEDAAWYREEVELLARRLTRPVGSRQHFLSFDYDALFTAQEQARIEYDMSMGFPDRPGPRAGFSFPYFPYDLKADRPYPVLQISLFLMDVTLRGYMNLRPAPARRVIDASLDDLKRKRGGASVVWHPIVFGGARDPGYGELYFDMVSAIGRKGGWATDGRSMNHHWRARARRYESFRTM